MIKSIISLLFLIFAFPALLSANESSATGLVIEDAWIAEAPPVSKVMVAYMTIKNTGSEEIEIIRAESELYSSIEFHETVHEDGMARMFRYSSLTIPANGSIQLQRGGKHFMLFNPKKPLKAADNVTIKLSINNGQIKTITVPVKKSQF